jgi:hypothetical protein
MFPGSAAYHGIPGAAEHALEFAWLGLHLLTLLGGRNRISAFVNLSWRYLSWRRGGGLIVGDDRPCPGWPRPPAR